MSSVGSGEYFDLGSWNSWNLVDWTNNTIDVSKLDNYLNSYASELLSRGIHSITLSFAQASDINAIINNDTSALLKNDVTDSLGTLLHNTSGYKVTLATGQQEAVFPYVVQTLTQDGINVGLSFGGADASDADWTFNPSPTLAQELANWALNIGLSSIDFDIEDPDITKVNSPSALASFFTTLHTDMKGFPVTLTTQGDINTWGPQGTVFKSMFECGKFQDMFDGLNLMLYWKNNQQWVYALSAQTPPTQTWDLGSWMSELETNTGLSAKDSASYLNIGFDACINYTEKQSSAGPLPYSSLPSDVTTSGQAAAYIYQQMEKKLQEIAGDPTLSLGKPFFWDDNATYTIASDGSSQFFSGGNSSFEQDFYGYL